jgi:hypothetical protein
MRGTSSVEEASATADSTSSFTARTTGVGQKIDLSLLGGQVRLMGWTLQTAMWRNQNPVTGQARVTGTRERPGISASFDDRDGKPLVFQLTGPDNWKDAMTALGFYERLEKAGFADLGVIIDNDARRIELLATLDSLFATGTRDDWVARLRGADIVSAPINTLLEASNDPDVVANGYVTEVEYPKLGKKLKVHGTPWKFSETPAKPGIAPELGEHNDSVLGKLGYDASALADLRARNVPPTFAALYRADSDREGPPRRGWLERPRSGEGRTRLYARQPVAQPRRVHHGPRRHRGVSQAQMGARARLSPDQGTVDLCRQPHRRPLRLRIPRRQRHLVSRLRQRELGI